MKKVFAVILVVLILAGCAADQSVSPEPESALDDGGVIEIEEQYFVAQANQITSNRERYLGRTIRFEGMSATTYWDDEPFLIVYRNTYGCCGPDGIIGFEVALNDIEPFPDNTWVEVTGVLEEFDIFGGHAQILIVNATSIVEMPSRGLEFVY